jgi:hypothetical protein
MADLAGAKPLRGAEYKRRRMIGAAVLAAAGLFLLPPAPAAGPPATPALTADRVAWSSVELYGSRLGNSVTVTIELARLPAAGIDKGFLPSPQGRPYAASGPEVMLIEVRTRIEPLALSPVTLESRVWFAPREALPLQRFRSRRGEADFDQSFRFTHEGVFRRQLEPRTPAETPLPAARWTKTDESFYAYPGGPAPTETSLLIYILSAADFAAGGEPLVLNVFNRRQFHQVALRADPARSLPADLTVRKPGSEAQVQRTVTAVPVRLESRPLDPQAREKEDFSFLGLKNDIVLFIEKDSRLPVQVNGMIPGVGHVELRAREIKLKER